MQSRSRKNIYWDLFLPVHLQEGLGQTNHSTHVIHNLLIITSFYQQHIKLLKILHPLGRHLNVWIIRSIVHQIYFDVHMEWWEMASCSSEVAGYHVWIQWATIQSLQSHYRQESIRQVWACYCWGASKMPIILLAEDLVGVSLQEPRSNVVHNLLVSSMEH